MRPSHAAFRARTVPKPTLFKPARNDATVPRFQSAPLHCKSQLLEKSDKASSSLANLCLIQDLTRASTPHTLDSSNDTSIPHISHSCHPFQTLGSAQGVAPFHHLLDDGHHHLALLGAGPIYGTEEWGARFISWVTGSPDCSSAMFGVRHPRVSIAPSRHKTHRGSGVFSKKVWHIFLCGTSIA